MQTTFPLQNLLDKLTPADLERIRVTNDERVAKMRARDLERRARKIPPKFTVVELKTAREAREYRLNMEMKWRTNPHQILAEAHTEQFELSQKITSLEAISKKYPNDTEVQRRVHGYEDKVKPSLPGRLDEYFHVDGLLQRAKDRLADVEKTFEFLEIQVARFDADMSALTLWPSHRIVQELNLVNDEAILLNGGNPQRR
jgi:hypothetical protein